MKLSNTKIWQEIEGCLESEMKKLRSKDHEWREILDDFGGEELLDEYMEDGFETGLRWLRESTLEEAENFINALPELMRNEQFWPDDETAGNYCYLHQEDDEWMPITADAFWCGFVRGCLAQWKHLRKHGTLKENKKINIADSIGVLEEIKMIDKEKKI
jgi:hypothetical protein